MTLSLARLEDVGASRPRGEFNLMPTILVVEGYAKFWLSALAYSVDFKRPQLRRIRELAEEHEDMFLDRWEDYFGD